MKNISIKDHMQNTGNIELYENHDTHLIIFFGLTTQPHIVVDTVLDVYGSCIIESDVVLSPINVLGSLWMEYDKIVPGTYVNTSLFNKNTHGLLINGYFTEKGIIS